tara:strand:+ start:393 stop:584 length:192 start_codon:yes stop_codon:yes gene_type:complete
MKTIYTVETKHLVTRMFTVKVDTPTISTVQINKRLEEVKHSKKSSITEESVVSYDVKKSINNK